MYPHSIHIRVETIQHVPVNPLKRAAVGTATLHLICVQASRVLRQLAVSDQHGKSPWLPFDLPEVSDTYSTASWAGFLWGLSVTGRTRTANCCLSSSAKNITGGAAWTPQVRRMI